MGESSIGSRTMYTKSEVIEKLRPVFKENNVRKAILFGSYAKGVQMENSDIDILVDSGLHGLDFFGLLEEVNAAVAMPVDLIDVSHLTDDSLQSDAEKTGVVIYERS